MRHLMAVLALVGLAAVPWLHGQSGPYKFAREIAIGGEGGWDYAVGRRGGAPPVRQPRGPRSS